MSVLSGRGSRTALWVSAALFSVQGFGSVITEAAWHSSFGISGILVGAGAPVWISWVIGGIGLVLLGCVLAVSLPRGRRQAGCGVPR
ncbi:hypothetical protein [Amycolatopsis sp. CA-230715]|uniref:hypothetical protein n=1 Tax=Amycolatopsis sp. CA-230715 TaxID=2745196 RepID=UPI001C32B7B7|nr:hypothetical protein [Amycolatopsis sp. CA-230715]QWF79947.1 hypothetical protein HUW46_03360 [Amycolatopsis sp. CA-230715]